MNRPDHHLMHQWHTAVNQFSLSTIGEWPGFMYHGKQLANELPRLTLLFQLERTGQLPKIHRQCSRSEPVEVVDNHLTCCLGVACRDCPYLKALEVQGIEPEVIDQMKAFTCAAHVLENINQVDASEGFILTTDDQMYWQNVYESLASAWDEEE